MKTTLWVLLFLCTSVLFAEVLFYDNFNRADGAVGNGWTNIGPATTAIENNAMKITSPNGTGIKRDFTSIISGIYYIQFDWKVVSTDWYADAFPTGLTTHLVIDSAGDLCYDLDGTMSDPVVLTHVGLGVFVNVRLKINLDSDVFSVWVNNNLLASDLPGVATSTFYRFSFRGMGTNTVQYVESFIIMNHAAPSGLIASGGVNSISLNWDAIMYPEPVMFRIYRGTTSPALDLIAEVAGSNTQYTDNSAQANTDYLYRIKAIQAGNVETEYTSEVTSHLQSLISVTPEHITLNVGADYSDSTFVSISNHGNYDLNWSLYGTINIPESGLASYYPFDNNALDVSGNSNHGTVYGATPTTNRFGVPNSAFFFDGINDYLTMPSTFIFNRNGDAAMSFWMKKADANKRNIFWGKNDDIDANRFNVFTGNSGLGFQFDYRSPSGTLKIFNGTHMFTVATNVWTNIIVSRSGNTYTFYKDGAFVTSITDSSPALPTTTGTWRVSNGIEAWRYFYGSLDDVCFYERALTSEEVSSLYNGSYLSPYISVSPINGTLGLMSQQQVQITAISSQSEPITYVDTLYVNTNSSVSPVAPIVVTVNVDITPPSSVLNIEVDPADTDANQIGLVWTANAVADSVVTYKIYRRGRDELTWRQVGIVPKTQLWFVDNQFTGLDSTYVYYRVRAVDWVGNLGPAGTDVIASLERFLAPSNVQIANVENRDILLTWSPVTQTISGLPGTPTCYVVYKSQYPSPISDFDFLGVSFAEEYTHQWALYFQPLNRLFYVVTAYGGDMGRMNAIVAQKQEWKYGELESRLRSMEMFEDKK